MTNVIPLHMTTQAKAQGVFAQINVAARALGYSNLYALRVAQRARDEYVRGNKSAAMVVSQYRAAMRATATPECA